MGLIMWKLWHKLFGWNYVRVQYPEQGSIVWAICKIKTTPKGDKYIMLKKNLILLSEVCDIEAAGGKVIELT